MNKLNIDKLFVNPEDVFVTTLAPPPPPSISFLSGGEGKPVLHLESNGDIFVNGRLADNDLEVVEGMKKWISSHEINHYWKKKHDELGKEWAVYTDEWQKTIEMIEEESFAKDKRIKELEEYKFKYEQLCK